MRELPYKSAYVTSVNSYNYRSIDSTNPLYQAIWFGLSIGVGMGIGFAWTLGVILAGMSLINNK
jgi:hypothetical protein